MYLATKFLYVQIYVVLFEVCYNKKQIINRILVIKIFNNLSWIVLK